MHLGITTLDPCFPCLARNRMKLLFSYNIQHYLFVYRMSTAPRERKCLERERICLLVVSDVVQHPVQFHTCCANGHISVVHRNKTNRGNKP